MTEQLKHCIPQGHGLSQDICINTLHKGDNDDDNNSNNNVIFIVIVVVIITVIFCFVDRASQYIHLKKNQLDAQSVFSIIRQTPPHVSDVSIAYHQKVHRVDTKIGTHYSLSSRATDSHLKRIISTKCCIHTVYLLMIGYRYARNMQSCLTKYTEDRLCIKLVFLQMNITVIAATI